MPPTSPRSLETLQHTATETTNLVDGPSKSFKRPSKSFKRQLNQGNNVEVEVKRKIVSKKKKTQINFDNKVTSSDLTIPEKYWQLVVKKRQVAIQECLNENNILKKIIEDLKQENGQCKQIMDEVNSFVEVIREVVNASSDDTGIDVNDVSTANEHNED